MAVELDTRELDRILREMPEQASNLVNKWGVKIAGDAAGQAPVDTSALRNSILSESQMEGKLLFILQDGVNYGIFQELGTSRMSAHPFVVPAILRNEKGYINAWKELFK